MNPDARTPSPLVALALEVHDALMVVCPRGWRTAHVRLERTGGALRAAEVTTDLAAGDARPQPTLGLDPGAMLGVLNEALTEIEREARGWRGGALRFERAAHTATMLLVDEGAPPRAVELDEVLLDRLLFTEPFFDALLAAEPEAERQQRALVAHAEGHDDWSFDAPTATLALARGVLPWRSYDAQIVASYAVESDTFVWAWANHALDQRTTRAVAAMREAARGQRGLSALLRPTLPTGEAFAWVLARLAGVRIGAHGIYRASYGPGVLFIAVMDPVPAPRG